MSAAMSPARSLVRLVCWNEHLARERSRALTEAGIGHDASPLKSPGLMAHLRDAPPSAVLIDLDRLPSHGREVAVALRQSKHTRHIPVVFAGGAPEKVEAIRRELPDAVFTGWPDVARALERAFVQQPADPVKPPAHMQRYAGASLAKKLGFKACENAALIGAPDGFEESLGDLPEGVDLSTRITARTRMALWFVRSRRELDLAAESSSARLPEGASLWILHPKQTSRYKVDFNQTDVREAGLAVGLVDFKVCAVDADWTGLKFARKKTGKANTRRR